MAYKTGQIETGYRTHDKRKKHKKKSMARKIRRMLKNPEYAPVRGNYNGYQ